jgi:hypothetical protein
MRITLWVVIGDTCVPVRDTCGSPSLDTCGYLIYSLKKVTLSQLLLRGRDVAEW